jgi:hypothetical protein
MTALLVQLERKVFRASQALSVQPEQVFKELQVQQARKEFRVMLVLQAHKVYKVMPVQLDQQAHRVFKVFRVTQAQPVPQVQAFRELPGQLVYKVILD